MPGFLVAASRSTAPSRADFVLREWPRAALHGQAFGMPVAERRFCRAGS